MTSFCMTEHLVTRYERHLRIYFEIDLCCCKPKRELISLLVVKNLSTELKMFPETFNYRGK